MACPFSLRRKPEVLGDFEYNNDFSIVPLDLRLVDSLETGLAQINQDVNAIKKSLEPIGLSYLMKFVMQLPDFLRAYILEDFSNKMTFGFSNVPGPKTPIRTTQKYCQSMGFIMPVGKSLVGSFSIMSHADVVKIAIVMDKAVMPSIEPMKQYLIKNLDEILGGKDW